MERKPTIALQQGLGRQGFTLVELLVVITIIGILAALITAAGAGALKRARQARIKTEVDQMSMALQTFKDTYQSYPPNCQIDDDNATPGTEPTATPLSESQVLNDLKRAMKQAFPRNRESDDLLRLLVGLEATDTSNYPEPLAGGMSSGEALVFWLGGFSSDPKYPISGEGGPAYPIPSVGSSDNYKLDPVTLPNRVFPFEVARLEPRDADKFFSTTGNRFIEYQVRIPGQNNGNPVPRRINFWQYVPAQSQQPYLYFDVSRHPAGVRDGGEVVGTFDPPAATILNPNALHVHAVKTRSESTTDSSPIQFANKDKFQILHAGIDEEWGEEFEKMSAHGVRESGDDPNKWEDYLLYPNGPFTGDVADTITNFSEGTLEASQP